MTAVLLTLLGLTLLRLPVAALLAALLPDVSVAPEWNYAVSIVQSLVLLALPGWLLSERNDESAPARGKLPLWLLIAAAAAVLARMALPPLNDWWGMLIGANGADVPQVTGVAARILQVLALAVVPAVAEELFFRGALLPYLRRGCGRRAALLLTTLLFALMHGSPAGLPGHLTMGLLLTLLMLHSGRLLVPVTAHLVYNLTSLAGLQTNALMPWLCGGLLTALAAALVLCLPAGEEKRMGRRKMLLCCVILAVMAAQYFV